MPITTHANGEPLLKQSSSYSHFPTHGNGSTPTSKASSNLLMTILTDAFVLVIVSSIQTIREGVHYIRKSLIYSTRKAFLEKAMVELYKFDEKSYHKCLKR